MAVRVNDSDLVKELLIGTAAFTRFTFAEVVISGAGDVQSRAKFSVGKFFRIGSIMHTALRFLREYAHSFF